MVSPRESRQPIRYGLNVNDRDLFVHVTYVHMSHAQGGIMASIDMSGNILN